MLPGLSSQPDNPLSPAQGYKMDDLLTSYVQQLLSTVSKQRGSKTQATANS